MSLLRREGFTLNENTLLIKLNTLATEYNPHWSSVTMNEAHIYIRNHFDELETGSVIDCQFLRGDTETPVESERFS